MGKVFTSEPASEMLMLGMLSLMPTLSMGADPSSPLRAEPSVSRSATNPGTAPATPSNLQAQVVSSSRVDLSWIDNSKGTASAADSFQVERDSSVIHTSSTPIENYSDTTVSAGNIYTYRVRAFRQGTPSDYSNEVTVQVGGSQNAVVDARNNADTPTVVVNVPPNVTITISSLRGTACVNSGVGCAGPNGISQDDCNGASTVNATVRTDAAVSPISRCGATTVRTCRTALSTPDRGD